MSWEEILKTDSSWNLDWDNYSMGAYNADTKSIEYNPINIMDSLQRELGREPTEKEFEEAFKRTIVHEEGHAAHDLVDDKFKDRTSYEREWVAYSLQYPNEVYTKLKKLMSHSSVQGFLINQREWTTNKRAKSNIRMFLRYVDKKTKGKSEKEKNKFAKEHLDNYRNSEYVDRGYSHYTYGKFS
jgi:hypothetical protein